LVRSSEFNPLRDLVDETPNSDEVEMSASCLKIKGLAAGLLAFSALLLAAGCMVEVDPAPPSEVDVDAVETVPDHIWPPRVGERYPNLRLLNSRGERIALDSLAGRVILVDPIGMDCPACNAFAGGNRPGASGFQGVQPQGGLPAVEELLDSYAEGISLSDDRIALVHLLLYRPGRNGPPKLETARLWAEHFEIEESEDTMVLVGESYLIGPASYNMIPGFHLIDAGFVLRFDATGHKPKHNLWSELLPAVPSLINEVSLVR
jgi:hypothetical protein